MASPGHCAPDFFPPDVDPPKLRMYTKTDGLKKIYLLSNMTILDILNFSGGDKYLMHV